MKSKKDEDKEAHLESDIKFSQRITEKIEREVN